jgi:cytochrome c oxidase subunit III
MPATYTPRPPYVEPERREPGFGGRPPVSNRPTGGGGDGDSGDNSFRGPRYLLQRYRLALSFVLVADFVCFLALVSAFFVRQSSGHFDASDNYIADWRPLRLPAAVWLGTGLLALSCVTVEFGRRQLFREMDVIEEWLGLGQPMAGRTWPWLAATAVLGSGYLWLTGVAWQQLAHRGLSFASDPESACYYILSGSHAAHILLGVALLGVGALGLYRLRRVEQRQILVDCVAWFWHAMCATWFVLFALLSFNR